MVIHNAGINFKVILIFLGSDGDLPCDFMHGVTIDSADTDGGDRNT